MMSVLSAIGVTVGLILVFQGMKLYVEHYDKQHANEHQGHAHPAA